MRGKGRERGCRGGERARGRSVVSAGFRAFLGIPSFPLDSTGNSTLSFPISLATTLCCLFLGKRYPLNGAEDRVSVRARIPHSRYH